MGYATEPLEKLGRAARWVGTLMAGLSLILILASGVGDGPTLKSPRTLVVVSLVCLLPATLMVALSFPTQRGHLWAAVALLVVCLCQLPSVLLLSSSCVTWPLSAYFIARCVIALPEVRFQLRAARRQHYAARGFDPLPIAPTHATPQPPPASLKPSPRPRPH